MNTRRNCLRAPAAMTLAIPWLEWIGGFAHAAEAESPRRLLMICLPLGIYRRRADPRRIGQSLSANGVSLGH